MDNYRGHRPDCTFVYMTHDIEFPTSRTDNVTVWVRGCNIQAETWDYEIIRPHESLSDQLIIDLMGSRKPVLLWRATAPIALISGCIR